jgi:DNA processing protein
VTGPGRAARSGGASVPAGPACRGEEGGGADDRARDPVRWARAALSRLAEPEDAELGEQLEALGPVEVLDRIDRATLRSPRLDRYRARLGSLDVEADLRRARAAGTRLVVPGDPEWPVVLDDLGPRRPVALWVRGPADLAGLCERAVAVVGARACTAYGEHVAAELAAGLCDRGWTVVSGAAYGIDGAAHRGALAADGGTVAVLACGVDVVYPRGHDALIGRVAAAGAVASELPPGSMPSRRRFLQRNRLIAALSRGTVVVEAALRSGAANTAGHAAALSRPVMAVPGPVTSASSAGCHELLRTRDAALVTDARDVLDLVGRLGVDDSPPRRGPERPEDGLGDAEQLVWDVLPVARARDPVTLAGETGLPLPGVLRALALLVAAGLAEDVGGRWRKAPRRG